jgi:hypothetical protein
MRREDALEVWFSGRMRPGQAARASFNRTPDAKAVFCGSDLLAVYGAVRQPGAWSVPWALTTTHVESHRAAYYAASAQVISELRKQHPRMGQLVWSGYPRAVKWLARLGFSAQEPIAHGPFGEMFVPMTMITEVPHV